MSSLIPGKVNSTELEVNNAIPSIRNPLKWYSLTIIEEYLKVYRPIGTAQLILSLGLQLKEQDSSQFIKIKAETPLFPNKGIRGREINLMRYNKGIGLQGSIIWEGLVANGDPKSASDSMFFLSCVDEILWILNFSQFIPIGYSFLLSALMCEL